MTNKMVVHKFQNVIYKHVKLAKVGVKISLLFYRSFFQILPLTFNTFYVKTYFYQFTVQYTVFE